MGDASTPEEEVVEEIVADFSAALFADLAALVGMAGKTLLDLPLTPKPRLVNGLTLLLPLLLLPPLAGGEDDGEEDDVSGNFRGEGCEGRWGDPAWIPLSPLVELELQ